MPVSDDEHRRQATSAVADSMNERNIKLLPDLIYNTIDNTSPFVGGIINHNESYIFMMVES
jgi:hypothetical protein